MSKPFVARKETGSSRWGKHDESHINITKNRKFVSFLDESIPPLGESDLPVCGVLNLLDLKPHSPHVSPCSHHLRKPINIQEKGNNQPLIKMNERGLNNRATR